MLVEAQNGPGDVEGVVALALRDGLPPGPDTDLQTGFNPSVISRSVGLGDLESPP